MNNNTNNTNNIKDTNVMLCLTHHSLCENADDDVVDGCDVMFRLMVLELFLVRSQFYRRGLGHGRRTDGEYFQYCESTVLRYLLSL